MNGLSGTQRGRLLALGILAGVVLLVLGGALYPLWQWHRDYDTRISQMRSELKRYANFAAVREGLAQRLRELESLRQRGGFQLSAATGALAAAQLQGNVKRMIMRNGGKLVSMRVLGEKDEPHGLRRIAVQVRMKGDTESLANALYALESERPLLFLDNVQIIARPSGLRSSATPATQLDIQFDIYSFAAGSSA